MEIDSLMAALKRVGIQIEVNSNKLSVRAPKNAMTPELSSGIKEHKDLLLRLFGKVNNFNEQELDDDLGLFLSRKASESVRGNGSNGDQNSVHPVTYSQRGLWSIHQLEGRSAHYNMYWCVPFSEPLNIASARHALKSITQRHDILRSNFFEEKGEVFLKISDKQDARFVQSDFSDLNETLWQEKLVEIADLEKNTNFDLSSESLVRVHYVQFHEKLNFLLFTLHHIVADGLSIQLFRNEFSAAYQALQQGNECRLPNLALQFTDYIQWQNDYLKGVSIQKEKQYWRNRLHNIPTLHAMPLDKRRSTEDLFSGKCVTRALDQDATSNVLSLCRAEDVSVFILLHTCFSLLLSKFSGSSDIIVGSPYSGRGHVELDKLIGQFVNTLVLRCQVHSDFSFSELLQSNKQNILADFSHQNLPFEVLLDELNPPRSLAFSPLFQIFFSMQNAGHVVANKLNETVVDDIAGSGDAVDCQTKYDLTLNIRQQGDILAFDWSYKTSLFADSSIEQLSQSFIVLLESIVNNPSQQLSDIEYFGKNEKQRLLLSSNNTQRDYPADKCIHELFEYQASLSPDSLALLYEDGSLTYRELNRRSNQVAHCLVSSGVRPGNLVGLCVERSLEMVIGILAVLKSGGAYVPLDPFYPIARIKFMLEDSGVNWLLTQERLVDDLPEGDYKVVLLDARPRLSNNVDHNIEKHNIGLTFKSLAYVIYTSGSTGRPKGVMVEHQNVVNFVNAMSRQPGITSNDSLLAVTSTSFDIHGLEIFLPLSTGARLTVAPQSATSDPAKLLKLMDQHNISIMQATPATWKMLLDSMWQQSKKLKVLCGGEALGLNLADQMLAMENVELWNLYGPTETTIWSAAKQVLPTDEQILIGQPIDNTQIYVVSNSIDLVPPGVAGELLIGGVGLSRGYLNRPSLTAQGFIPNPFYVKSNSAGSERLYKTGDLVRWLADGNLEYLGRIDHQVKIRGFRIELGEIEEILNTYADVNDAIVVAKESEAGEKRLVAYVVTRVADPGAEDESSTQARHDLIECLRVHASQALPDYMVPSAFMIVEQLPLTPNGKVDRKALPEVDFSSQQNSYVAPRTETEKAFCEVWQNVLGVNTIGINDNFFHLGGDSLLIMLIVVKIKEQGFSIQPRDIYSAQTIKEISKIAKLAPLSDLLDHSYPEVGVIPLTPWQKALLIKKDGNIINRFNSRYHQQVDFSVDPDTLSLAFNHIVLKHGALRLQVNRNGLTFSAEIKEHLNDVQIDFMDLSDLDSDKQGEITSRFFESDIINIDAGQVIRVALCKLDPQKPDHLIITVNHLVCDIYSLNIIFEDLISAYKQIESGQEVTLPAASTSPIFAANKIDSFCKSETLKKELDYWASLPVNSIAELNVDYADVKSADIDSGKEFIWRNFSPEQTQYLIQYLLRLEGSTIADLLAVLAVEAQRHWLGGEFFRVNVLNNGRNILEGEFYTDLSRAVGYYNLTKLLILKPCFFDNELETLADILSRVNSVPTKGVGVRYLLNRDDDVEITERLEPLKNYLKTPKVMSIQYFGVVGSNEVIGIGPDDSKRIGNIYSISLEAQILNGSMQLRWSYNKNIYAKETINRIVSSADNFMQKILMPLATKH